MLVYNTVVLEQEDWEFYPSDANFERDVRKESTRCPYGRCLLTAILHHKFNHAPQIASY